MQPLDVCNVHQRSGNVERVHCTTKPLQGPQWPDFPSRHAVSRPQLDPSFKFDVQIPLQSSRTPFALRARRIQRLKKRIKSPTQAKNETPQKGMGHDASASATGVRSATNWEEDTIQPQAFGVANTGEKNLQQTVASTAGAADPFRKLLKQTHLLRMHLRTIQASMKHGTVAQI